MSMTEPGPDMGPLLKMMKVLLAAEYARLTPRCPNCRDPMKKCFARKDNRPFWGCSRYPLCRGFRGMRRSARWRGRVEHCIAEVDARLEALGTATEGME